jgi:hypothetical protein
MKAGIESSARPERIAATDELQLHENPSSRPRAGEGKPHNADRGR